MSDFEQLESIVRAAGGYVEPTDDLRPEVLEAARGACRQRRLGRRLCCWAVLVVLVSATGFPGFLFSSSPGLIAVQSSELQRRAALSVIENGTEANWALYEVFSELRRERSERFHVAD